MINPFLKSKKKGLDKAILLLRAEIDLLTALCNATNSDKVKKKNIKRIKSLEYAIAVIKLKSYE